MGLFTDLFSPRVQQAQPVKKETFVLSGSGTFDVQVSGTDRRQDRLESICGKREARGIHRTEAAYLILDDTHPRERLLVWVEIRGRRVGYLPREVAAMYRQGLIDLGKDKADGQCQATIQGGWVSSDGRKGDYEVWLDLPRWAK